MKVTRRQFLDAAQAQQDDAERCQAALKTLRNAQVSVAQALSIAWLLDDLERRAQMAFSEYNRLMDEWRRLRQEEQAP